MIRFVIPFKFKMSFFRQFCHGDLLVIPVIVRAPGTGTAHMGAAIVLHFARHTPRGTSPGSNIDVIHAGIFPDVGALSFLRLPVVFSCRPAFAIFEVTWNPRFLCGTTIFQGFAGFLLFSTGLKNKSKYLENFFC